MVFLSVGLQLAAQGDVLAVRSAKLQTRPSELLFEVLSHLVLFQLRAGDRSRAFARRGYLLPVSWIQRMRMSVVSLRVRPVVVEVSSGAQGGSTVGEGVPAELVFRWAGNPVLET